ncbi:piggyBac transposable element-derived protein 4-like [Corythoichthys intestinalis]|uniref:piggyBac transposable element-derived protein 4-like n=1 Tax=Corythoichthys intestinalis TaxID=161448 RepID=UPI0025A5095F|nr:piggyBac transposable element-derived protein 4-like [Corythoichthys intestinalis]XP_061804428.1 piggyBac transposable element-derived protein 4-like [Nerophis lumbriciformis]
MRRTLNVQRVLKLFYDEEDISSSSSSSEDEEENDEDEEMIDPSFGSDDVASDGRYEHCGPSCRRSTQRRCGTRSQTRSRSPQPEPLHHLEPWRTGNDPDIAPPISPFMPRRPPGAQLDSHVAYSPRDLFQLYFSPATLHKLCENTNKQAARNKEMGKKNIWVDVDVEELCKFIGLLIFTSVVSMPNIKDYWKQDTITSLPFPGTVMPRDRFRNLLTNIHPSDPEEDRKNDKRKGTPSYDKLFKMKPLIDDILRACQAHYHSRRELAVDERPVERRTGKTQSMTVKPAKWGMKLIVLVDSSNGYTVSFNVHVEKNHTETEHGLAYDAVMNLIQPLYLCTGYHVYMDNFYSSPQLFLKLAELKFGACGTYRDNKSGCPTNRENALTKTSERGAVRWIREGYLVFVKWMDTQEVSMCSTIHPAFSGEVVKRRVKDEDGRWSTKEISCPTPVIAYNRNMCGVDLSDQLLQYYSTNRETVHWCRKVFLHLVDIAATNAYLLQCEISTSNQMKPMSRKDFQTELAAQLCGVDWSDRTSSKIPGHVPVPIAVVTDSRLKTTQGRRKCKHCHQMGRRNLTPWMCKSCNVSLCVILDRNCFEEWHT